jgi:putative membrane protein
MKFIILFLKGMAIGVANVMPGVSTGTFMVLLGIYDGLIEAIGNFFSNRKMIRHYLLFLVPFGLGAVFGTLAFANLVTFVLDRYPVPAQFFFIGLIAGSIPSVVKMHHDMRPTSRRAIAFAVGLILAILVGLGGRGEEVGHSSADASTWMGLLYFGIVGFFAGGAVITPGMSGSYIFLLAGTYGPIMQALASLTQPPVHRGVIVSVAVGVGIGVLICSKLIDLALKRQPAVTFYAILGLICGSFVGLWPAELDASASSLASILTLASGIAIAYLLGKPAGNRSKGV